MYVIFSFSIYTFVGLLNFISKVKDLKFNDKLIFFTTNREIKQQNIIRFFNHIEIQTRIYS